MGLEQAHHGFGASQRIALMLRHERRPEFLFLQLKTELYAIMDIFAEAVKGI